MHPSTLAAALSTACLLWTASAGSAQTDQDVPGDAHGTVSDAHTVAAPFQGAVIERTLGEGPSETIVISQGTVIRLVLHAPAGTELHLHGYDLAGVAGREGTVIMTFRAGHLGRFPIEGHVSKDVLGRKEKVLAYIEVRSE